MLLKMILQYPKKGTSGWYCSETPIQIFASTNFFFYKNGKYQQPFTINKTSIYNE